MKKVSKTRRGKMPPYIAPDPQAVRELQGAMFRDRFVDDHLSALLGRASSAIAAEFHEGLRRHRIPIPHWRILASLSGSAGSSLSHLAELTLINQPTVSRLVQRLERTGLIQRSADASDRRITRVSLTSRGRDKVRELIAIASDRQGHMLQGIDGESLKADLRYLIAFCAARRGRKPHP